MKYELLFLIALLIFINIISIPIIGWKLVKTTLIVFLNPISVAIGIVGLSFMIAINNKRNEIESKVRE